MWLGHSMPSLSCLTAMSTLLLSLNRDQRNLDFLDTPQNVTLVHYTDDTMLTGLTKQEVASISGATCMQKVGEKSWESSRACHLCALFLQWSGACQDIPSTVRDEVLYLELSNTKKRITVIMFSLNSAGNVCHIWGCCSDHLPQFEWGSKQQKVLQQAQATV